MFNKLRTLQFFLYFAFCLMGEELFAKENEIHPEIKKFQIDFKSEDALVLEVNISGQLILDSSIVAYIVEDKVFLPLTNFSKILEFPIHIVKDSASVSGWFINPDKEFSLSLIKGICLAHKAKYGLSKKDAVYFDGDIYVNVESLSKWFGFEILYDQENQAIQINSGGILPVEQRIDRQKRQDDLEKSKNNIGAKEEKVIVEKTKYNLISVPFGDLRYRYDYDRAVTKEKTTTSKLDITASGDLLYMNNQIFATVENEELINFRMMAGRKDPEGKMFGFMKTTDFAVGDISTPQIPLISRIQTGKGGYISNFPLDYAFEFDKVPIRGVVKPGFDVEIYRNGSLLDFKRTGADGIYEFNDVPLIAGINNIKIVSHGPYGETSEEIKRYVVSDDILKQGRFYYRLANNKNNESLVKASNSNNLTTTNLSDGKERSFSEFGYGLTKQTSLGASFVKIPLGLEGLETKYGSTSVRTQFYGILTRVDLVRDLTNNLNSKQFLAQTQFGNFSFTEKYKTFDKNFISEENQESANPMLDELTSRIDGPIVIPGISKEMRFTVTNVKQNFLLNNNRNDINTDLYLSLTKKLQVTQNYRYIKDDRNSEVSQQIIKSGRTIFNYRLSESVNLRGTLSYNFAPVEEMTNSNLSIDYRLRTDINMNLSQNHRFAQQGQPVLNNYLFNLNKIVKQYIIGFGTSYADDDSYGGNINVSTSFGYDTKNNIGIMSATPIANFGAVSAKVFLDENDNDVYDKGEKPLKDIVVEMLNGGGSAKTDEKGVAFIGNVQTNLVAQVRLKNESLLDPYLMTKKERVDIITHSGSIAYVDFPVIMTGEIEGYVNFSNKTPAANVSLNLYKNGKIVKKAVTAFDGLFLFDQVPFGEYKIAVSPAQQKRIGFKTVGDKKIKLSKDKQILSAINFEIERIKGFKEDKEALNVTEEIETINNDVAKEVKQIAVVEEKKEIKEEVEDSEVKQSDEAVADEKKEVKKVKKEKKKNKKKVVKKNQNQIKKEARPSMIYKDSKDNEEDTIEKIRELLKNDLVEEYDDEKTINLSLQKNTNIILDKRIKSAKKIKVKKIKSKKVKKEKKSKKDKHR